MTHQRTLTAAHWGVYEVEYDDNGKAMRLHPFAKDPDPSPIGLHTLSDEVARLRVRKPAVRKSWLEKGPGANPEKRGQEPFVELEWDQALDLVARELKRVKDTHSNRSIFGGSYGWSSASSHGTSTKGSCPRLSLFAPGPFSSQLLRKDGRRTRIRATSSDNMCRPIGEGSGSFENGCSFVAWPLSSYSTS